MQLLYTTTWFVDRFQPDQKWQKNLSSVSYFCSCNALPKYLSFVCSFQIKKEGRKYSLPLLLKIWTKWSVKSTNHSYQCNLSLQHTKNRAQIRLNAYLEWKWKIFKQPKLKLTFYKIHMPPVIPLSDGFPLHGCNLSACTEQHLKSSLAGDTFECLQHAPNITNRPIS